MSFRNSNAVPTPAWHGDCSAVRHRRRFPMLMNLLTEEVLFWIAMAVLVVFLAVRLHRRVLSQQATLDSSLDEAFERHRSDDRAA
jgi:hypothetical protein